MHAYQVTLRTKNRYMDIKLNLDDTKQTIQQKIKEVCPEQKVDLQDLVNKIIKQLVTMNSRAYAQKQATQIAREKVNKMYKEEKSPIHSQWTVSQIAVNSRTKSCASDLLTLSEKLCYQKCVQTQQNQSEEQNPSKFHRNKSFNTYSLNKTEDDNERGQRAGIKIESNKALKLKKLSTNISNGNKQNKSKQEKENRKRCNPDMIKACEAIMKKSNHNAMKIMAKEFLKQKGYLAEDLITHQRQKRRTYLVPYVTQNPQNQSLLRQNQNDIRRQRFQTLQSNILVESKSINLTEISNKNSKAKSKYTYNISPNIDNYSYSLNGSYQNQPRLRMTETSVQKCVKKYNYLQN